MVFQICKTYINRLFWLLAIATEKSPKTYNGKMFKFIQMTSSQKQFYYL